MCRVKDRVAIVTGGGMGIGLAIAVKLGNEGAKVAIIDQDSVHLKKALKHLNDIGVETIGYVGDVSDQEIVEQVVEDTVRIWKRIDILVNNAGIVSDIGNICDVSVTALDLAYRVNLRGVFLLCHYVVPVMLRFGYGRIVNIASIAGKEGNPGTAIYSATKAGVIGLTKSLGKELATSDVNVNCVAPASVRTKLLLDSFTKEQIQRFQDRIPMGRFGEDHEIADLVSWLSSEECSFSTASVFDASGGRATY